MLLDVVLRGAKTEEPRWEYKDRERRYRKECPAWFEDEDYFEPDERPINESSIADVVSAVVTDPAVKGLQDRLRAMEKTQQVLIWMLGLVLLVLIVQRWS